MAKKKEEKIKGISLVAEEIKKQKLSLHKVSMRADVTIPTIIKVKRGEPCGFTQLARICDALGLEIKIERK